MKDFDNACFEIGRLLHDVPIEEAELNAFKMLAASDLYAAAYEALAHSVNSGETHQMLRDALAKARGERDIRVSRKVIDRIGKDAAVNAAGMHAVRNTLLGSDGGEA